MSPSLIRILTSIIVSIACILVVVPFLIDVFANFSTKPEFSDIIPQTKTLVSRLLEGVFPYREISDWGYSMYPTYLPLQWMPFILPEVLHFDYRWMAFAVFCVGFMFYLLFILHRKINLFNNIILLILPFIAIMLFIWYDAPVFGFTIESLIGGYYLILCLSFFSKSVYVRALGLTLCLLSRYSLVLWIPLYILIIYFSESKKNAIWISAITLLGVLFIYGPFLGFDSNIFLNGYRYHTTAAVGEWGGHPWQELTDKPFHLFRGVGIAAFFYDFAGGELIDRLHLLQRVHLLSSIGIVLLLGLFFFRFKSKINYPIFALASLKIYLAIFYNFIQIPYVYLFFILIIISLPIIAISMIDNRENILQEN